MPIDVTAALAAEPATTRLTWTERDVLLYHLSLGAAADPVDRAQLRWAYERTLRTLPTFAVVAGRGISAGEAQPPGLRLPGVDVDVRRILHAGQRLRLHAPIPAAGTVRLASRTKAVHDKGKAALVVVEQRATADDDTHLWTAELELWARGEGGFGGDRGPAAGPSVPDRVPDHVLTVPTSPRQALLYRLNGDLNPLHADPDTASAAGFERPILHGLATYGTTCRAVVDELLGGDPSSVAGFDARFAGTLTPGETLRVRVWREAAGWRLAADCPERGYAPVLDRSFLALAE